MNARLEALRVILRAQDDEDIDAAYAEPTYIAATTLLGEPVLERLATICTGERWSHEDMVRCANNTDDLTALLARLEAPGSEL